MSLEDRLKKLTVAGALSLPAGVKRRLAGKPVVLDGATLDVDTQLLLRLQKVARETAAETLPIPDGRERLAAQSVLVGGNQPIGSTAHISLAGIPARVYVPTTLLGSEQRPTLVFLHGGGFIYGGGHSTHEQACRFLAERSGVQLISVDYRLAPEATFPAAYDDAVAAFRTVVSRASSLKVDLDRIAVGGDSAGGNLAATVALATVDDDVPPVWQLLVYPMTDCVGTTESRRMFGQGFFLTDEFIELALESYVPDHEDRKDPRVSPLLGTIPAGVAPAHVVTAGFDPLRDEGEAYAEHLRSAGVAVTHRREPGLMHGFFNTVGVGTSGPAAVADIASRLAIALR
ncbi:alpha/beta hydrolase [Nocardioides sp. Root151]|uniref:alpha/beta hydrolase n=1 Tax=Nocardioides sp. Root151 TaxID=1736475 RepID=UPI000702DF51|nr:alpha/beta hydrolase [Nocardioides sp. Root151]KQZ66850.1 alpha/beta hydrolase [Nocardioides sp. Root151]